ncbi:MAG: apolipoprotein N-acyltransferase [Planctomycetota bacterium]|nr:apolipoprotein N-acyltransferase [Planctomycetota bacterium]
MATQILPQTSPTGQSSKMNPASAKRHELTVREIIEAARSAPAPVRGAVACSLTTAVLLWSSFTPLDWGWLGWIALSPLILLVRLERPTRFMYPVVYASGLVWSLATLQWMRLGDPSMYIAWAVLSIYVALYFPVCLAISRGAVHRFGLPLLLTVPVVWTGLEYLRATLMTGFAWYFLGHTQYAWPEMIQVSDLVGAYGVSFVVALAATCVAGLVPLAWLERLKLFPPVLVPSDFAHLPTDEIVTENSSLAEFRRPWLNLGITLAVVAAAFIYGAVRRSQADFQPGPRVALIQGNFPTSLKHSPDEYTAIFRYHDALTGMAVQHQPDLIVWPETMFRWPLQIVESGVEEAQLLAMAPPFDRTDQVRWMDSWTEPTVRRTLHEMSERASAAMIIGIDTWVAGHDDIRAYNSSVLVTPQTGISSRYDKIHRVIFGEYTPLKDELPFLAAMSPLASSGGLSKGEAAKVFRYGGWNLAPIICFEDTVPHLVREIAHGAEASNQSIDVFVNQTNDGWFKGSSELNQHLITASFRAVETRTPLVRAVNTGISAVIDGDGVLIEPNVFINGDAETREESVSTMRDPATGELRKSLNAAVIADVPLDSRSSFYVEHGDWFAQGCCVGAIFCAFVCPFRRRQRI